ncbi:hypothetical protein C1H87_10575 [Flavivirga eckloniae]|uniref:Uncharacterized protein n=1 Tax=Flavivirga eckloniae TaxID=1803846 RepID=A0A2K9PPZ5_9FLAO|nr:hypothetical protein C1H87_10575 [Flavivirga eckloniae]
MYLKDINHHNKKLKLFLRMKENKTFELPENQKIEIDRRLSRMEKGETKFYTWEQVEQKLKQAL